MPQSREWYKETWSSLERMRAKTSVTYGMSAVPLVFHPRHNVFTGS